MKLFTTLTAALILGTGAAFATENQPGAHFIENWDMNGDGSVSVADATEKRGDVFYMFDQNEDGYLDAQEYVLFDQTRAEDAANNGGGHGKGNMKRMQEGMTLGFNDVNGDGKVSKDEFLTRTAAWIEMADRDGDGVISEADFGPRQN